jgi:hypothetical protein
VKSNLISENRTRNPAECSVSNPTIAEQALIRNPRGRFEICRIGKLNNADIFDLEKRSTVLFCALNRKTSLEQFQLAVTLSEDPQKILILTTQNRSLEESMNRRR